MKVYKMNAKVSVNKKSQKTRKKKQPYVKKHLVAKKNLSSQRRESNQSDSSSICLLDKKDQAVNNDSNSMVISLDLRPVDNSAETNEHMLHEHNAYELFNLVYSGGLVPLLPSRSWSIHYVEVPTKCIVITEMTIRFEVETGLIPVHTKQIVFDEKMNYELFFLNAKASVTNKSHVVKTLADLARVIMFVNNIRLCSGGPQTILHANVNLECAYRDPQGRWRHNLCTLEVTDSDTCESCLSLIELLQRNSKRNKVSTRVRDFTDTAKR